MIPVFFANIDYEFNEFFSLYFNINYSLNEIIEQYLPVNSTFF